LNGGRRETPEPLYGLDHEDGNEEIDDTTLVAVSQRPGNAHLQPTTPELTGQEKQHCISSLTM
jgi:hypothetical protein